MPDNFEPVQARRVGRLDERDVGSSLGDDLVSEMLGLPGEEVADLWIGVEDQHARHGSIIDAAGMDHAVNWYEKRMKRSRVLVVDDEADVRGLVRDLLERAGYDVVLAGGGRAALRLFFGQPADLVVLDVTMPDLDGWQTLERLRDLSDVPVLMLTGRASELEKVRGLKAGADDYLTKPFGRQELLARIEALLRRAPSRGDDDETYADGLVSIHLGQRVVTVGDRELSLTPREFRLLAAFARHPNQVLSHEQLLELVWGDPHDVSRDQVKLYVSYLRHKLMDAVPGRDPIETVRGFGYRYRPASA
jgi:DNA-binding response OmpR family regulator